ncbi:helix-turn-helix domain-containing protein [Streptomyces sp. NPDC049585]|uniref:helix-turn-helix domain-containing protein n=1 Tax=Streptomyces sp. NPDC049585 TaxID=3155154 RepID=UPI003431B690
MDDAGEVDAVQQTTRAGLLTSRREGSYVLYSLDGTRFDRIAAALGGLAGPGVVSPSRPLRGQSTTAAGGD